MRRSLKLCTALILVSMAVPLAARAVPITYVFDALVEQGFSLPGGASFLAGQTISGSFAYESTATVSPVTGGYALAGWEIEGVDLLLAGGTQLRVFESLFAMEVGSTASSTIPVGSVVLSLDYDGLPPGPLPTGVPPGPGLLISDFNVACCTGIFGSTGKVATITLLTGSVVPEPSTGLLLAGGLCALAGVRTKARRVRPFRPSSRRRRAGRIRR